MAERLMRQAFRQHLSAAGMVGLHQVFWIVRLLEEVEDFPVKFVGASMLPAATMAAALARTSSASCPARVSRTSVAASPSTLVILIARYTPVRASIFE